jgi:class 3 adenylate cyclase
VIPRSNRGSTAVTVSVASRCSCGVGISVGDLVHEAGDLHGLTANDAARLYALAERGEIVISDLVRTWVDRVSFMGWSSVPAAFAIVGRETSARRLRCP